VGGDVGEDHGKPEAQVFRELERAAHLPLPPWGEGDEADVGSPDELGDGVVGDGRQEPYVVLEAKADDLFA